MEVPKFEFFDSLKADLRIKTILKSNYCQ